MGSKEELTGIVGSENFSDDAEVLKTYSRDFSLSPQGMPNYVVKPKDAQEVQKVIQYANEHLIPVVPTSSKVHFNGASIPKQGGIMLDLSRMDQVLEIDELNRKVRIEAGVTWEKLTDELDKKGMRMIMPLFPHGQRSVVTDYLEREIPTNTVYDYGEPLQSMEVVWPTGEIFRTGSASVNGYPDSPSKGGNPSGPGIDFYRFLQGAQGTFGVVTWANLKIEYQPSKDKIYLAPVYDLDYAIDFLYRVLRIRIGQECLLLNSINLASAAAENWPEDFEKLEATLPPWTLVLVISGLNRRPDEKIKYEEEALNKIIRNEFPDMELAERLPGFPGLGKKLLPMLRKPWSSDGPYWKNRFQGACQSIFFITRPNLASMYVDKVSEIAALYDYPISEIGAYIQPIEHNRACHMEFNYFYDPDNPAAVDGITSLYNETIRVLLNEGAIFSRPYGELSQLVYEKAAGYTATLRRLKNVFDPKNIMNPGSLCF